MPNHSAFRKRNRLGWHTDPASALQRVPQPCCLKKEREHRRLSARALYETTNPTELSSPEAAHGLIS